MKRRKWMSPKNKAHNTVPTLFALSGLIGPHFIRIRSFRSDTFAPTDVVANVVGKKRYVQYFWGGSLVEPCYSE